MRAVTWTGSVPLLAVLVGCAAGPQSQQLADARTVVTQASSGRAAKYAPDDLLGAKKLLAKAEEAKDGSEAEVQYAYLADRAARVATSNGDGTYFVEQEQAANAKYHSLQESGRLDAQRQLADIERRLLEKDANVAELTAQKARLQSSLSTSSEALVASEKARTEAEARAAAAIASLAALGNVREEANVTVLTLSGSVLFKTGEATLLPLAADSLKRVADALMALPEERTVVVEGHTDSQGQDAANQQLSQARAQAVVAFLTQSGVSATRLSAVGRGEAEPVASNESAEGRANNRRVELTIQNAGPRPQASR